MTSHKNFKNNDKVVYGRGAFSQLEGILNEKRTTNGFMLFVVDDYFKGKDFNGVALPAQSTDVVYFLDCSGEEPTTDLIDSIRDEVQSQRGIPDGVVGIGGGSAMDIAKALSLMFTNEGSSQLYQGLNLVKNPGIYHVGVPTISGTGAEVSMTAVLTGPTKKLGLKCDWTVFNQIVLDPDLTASVPRNHWFYTGMDTYIHCIESETGQFKNTFSTAYANASLELCREVFLGPQSGQNQENDEKLMVASLMGGLSLTYSEVGVCHALSYGLSKILGYRHGIANCIAFNHLEDFYGPAVQEFKAMVAYHNIHIPQGLAAAWTEDQITAMAEVSYALTHMWNHAIGFDWKEKMSLDDMKNLFRRL